MATLRKNLRRGLCAFLAAVTLCAGLLPAAGTVCAAQAIYAPEFDVNAEIAYLVNLDTDLVLYDKNSEKQWSPASLTKLMTAILTLERVQDLDGTMLTMPRYVQDILYGTGSSTADIRPGETLCVRDLLYALLLPSAGEAALILADYLGGGDQEAFVSMMNARAAQLGCTGTHFSNPHGLYDPNNYTTARDMVLIARQAARLDGFLDIVQTLTYTLPDNARYPNGWVILNTDKMLMTAWPDYYRPYIKGIKTGTLDESGYNFVSLASQNGETYMLVVMGALGNEKWPHFRVTAQLLDWAYANFSVRPALDTEEPLTEVKVKYSRETDTLLLYPAQAVPTLLPADSDGSTVQKTYTLPEAVAAPVQAGDAVGTVTLSLAGQEIATVELLAGQDVKRNWVLFILAKIGEFFASLYFRVFFILLVICIAAYLAYMLYLRRKYDKMRKVRRRSPPM